MFSPVAHNAPRATSTIANPRSLSLAGRTVRHYSQNPGQKIDKLVACHKSAIALGGFIGGLVVSRDMLIKECRPASNPGLMEYLLYGGLGFGIGAVFTGVAIAAFPITLAVGGVYLLSKDKQ